MDNDLLKQAIDTINAGRKKEGAALLNQYVQTNPNSEMGWLWMAACIENEAQKRDCLQKVLEINPENSRAREALQKLETPVEEPTLDHILSSTINKPLPGSLPTKPSESDLIPAICPTCGGKLEVNPNSETLVCQYCGNEHFIRRNPVSGVTLEAYARCPVCHRNDRAEKVSAIVRSQTIQSQGAVSHESTQISNLASKLALPVEPLLYKEWRRSHLMLIFAVLSFIVGFSIIPSYRSTSTANGSGYLLLFAISGILLLADFMEKPSEKFKQKQDEQNLQRQKWQQAMARWEKLYYCGRDDNVFIPGEKTSAPVEKMIDYIYKN